MSDDVDVDGLLDSLGGNAPAAQPAPATTSTPAATPATADAGAGGGEGDLANMRISRSFTLQEFLHSQTAERNKKMRKAQMNPPPKVVEALRYLAATTLQPIRDKIAYPMSVSSGYRSPALNKAVKGSKTSQHCFGEAADIKLPDGFLTDEATAPLRQMVDERVFDVTGAYLRLDANANFYLFAYICLNLDALDIDQVIHEYGDGYGRPSWIHVSASSTRDKRQILGIGRYLKKDYGKSSAVVDLETALRMGV